MEGIWAIVLAAGESKRMGFPKMLLDFGGKTMIEMVIGNIKNAGLDNIMVVLGTYNGLLAKIVKKVSVRYCYNDDYKEGMLSSVKCGFRNLPSDIEAAVVFQGDQPFIRPGAIIAVLNGFRSSGRGIVVPVFRNKRGHPILIGNQYINEVEKLDTRIGLRSLMYQFSEEVLEVKTEEPGILRDFDTYDDYLEEIIKNQ